MSLDIDTAIPSLLSCHPIASPPEHSSVAAPSSQVVVVFARHPFRSRARCHGPCHAPPVPQCTHVGVQAHTCAWVTSLSPPQCTITFAPSRSHARFVFLCRHCRRARSTTASPLRTTVAAAKGLSGSALAPQCSPTQPHRRSRSEPAAV
jgi:hypothetical protein